VRTERVSTVIDHYLVARVQARVTGANAHDLHALLGKYFGLSSLDDEQVSPRLQEIERRLREFCRTGSLERC
jgi:hypothetical protein